MDDCNLSRKLYNYGTRQLTSTKCTEENNRWILEIYRIWGEIFMGQNFRKFRSWSNIRENNIRELGILMLLFYMASQHPRKFYPGIFIFGAIRETFSP